MEFLVKIKQALKNTLFIYPYVYFKNMAKAASSQSNESEILDKWIARIEVPRTFIEFGFSGWEFNCIRLASDKTWEGLLVDGDSYNVLVAKLIFHKRIESNQLWLTLDSLDLVRDYAKHRKIGILSIDVDGNDYWFLKTLIGIRPAIIAVEFNAAFGLRSITVPYDKDFDREQKSESQEYYGASLSAMHRLCTKSGYSLMDISESGINAFFVRNDLLPPGETVLAPEAVFGNKYYPDGTVAPLAEHWESIKHMPFVDVEKEYA